MLFRRDARHGLEPMGKMRGPFFKGPILHGIGDDVGHIRIQPASFLDGFLKGPVGRFGQAGLHDGIVENQAAKHIGNCFHADLSSLTDRCHTGPALGDGGRRVDVEK